MKDRIVIVSVLCALFSLSLLTTSCEDEFEATERAGETFLEENLEKGEFEMYLTRFDTVCGYHYDSTFLRTDTIEIQVDSVPVDTVKNNAGKDSIVQKYDTTWVTIPVYDIDTTTIAYEELPTYTDPIHKYKIDEYDDIPYIPIGATTNLAPIQTFENGLQYAVYWTQPPSANRIPNMPITLLLNYKVYFIDGTVLEGGRNRQVQYELLPYGVQYALQKMSTIGSRWRLWLPSELAYGSQGSEASPKIDPNTVLIYDIELMGVVR